MADTLVGRRKRPREGEFEREDGGLGGRGKGGYGGKGLKGGKRGGKGGKKGGPGPPAAPARRRVHVVVNRKTTAPFLLRTWVRHGAFVQADDFAAAGGEVPAGEVGLHIWEDTTLREVADMLAGTAADLGDDDAQLYFAVVTRMSISGDYRIRECAAPVSRRTFQASDKTVLFKTMGSIGDYLTVKVVSGVRNIKEAEEAAMSEEKAEPEEESAKEETAEEDKPMEAEAEEDKPMEAEAEDKPMEAEAEEDKPMEAEAEEKEANE